MALESKLSTNEKLRKCEVADEHHVGEQFSPVGPWVTLIKEALNAWAARQTPPLPPLPMSDKFDKATGDRVALFKKLHSPPILNYKGQIDRIVGKKTVVALDGELPRLGAAPIAATEQVDIVVGFQGAGRNEEFRLEDDAMPTRRILPYLRKHVLALEPKKKERSLRRFGSLTVTIGAQSKAMLDGFVRKVEESVSGDRVFGKVCIWGSSSGGRNALDFAHRLSNRGIPLEYVGILDAAFFPNETGDRPAGLSDPAAQKPPMFRQFHGVRGRILRNHFQTEGNAVKIVKHDLLSGALTLQWTSSMPGEEIHGEAVGFESKIVRSGLGSGDPHGALISMKKGEVLDDIARILNAL